MLAALLAGRLYPHGLEFEQSDANLADHDGIVLVVPGRYWSDGTAEITKLIARFRWVLAFRCGDEEDLFDISKVSHPNIKWWVQCPRPGRDYGTARFLGVGYTPHFTNLGAIPPAKYGGLFLSAQCTHERRRQAFEAIYSSGSETLGFVEPTSGFAQGMQPADYTQMMRQAKLAPAPAGAVSPDTFRVWEALTSHTMPIADDVSPAYDSHGFWQMLLPGVPFPVITDYTDLPGWITDQLADYPRNANRIAAWWIGEKRAMARRLREDLEELGADLA